ncbi:MAG: cyclic 2,3-diphosphoglycerate synthetase [Thermoplasmatota archaeon]
MKDTKIQGSIHIDESLLNILKNKKVLCLVDGQHYPPVTKWTINEIEKENAEVVSIVFLGGTEKVKNALEELDSGDKYGIYVQKNSKKIPYSMLKKAIKETEPDFIIDLSDEPVVDYGTRFKLASLVLKEGCVYFGADFIFTPPKQYKVLKKPSLSIIGTGKRVGKTGVSISIARFMKEKGYDPVIVCMGRGGPLDPLYIDTKNLDLVSSTLIDVAKEGRHAASDFWEDALLAQVPTIGCRRCGGGMAGNPFASNLIQGAEMTNFIPEKFVIMEGSGPTFPPVKTDANIVIIGANQPLQNITEFLGQYRLMISRLAIVTMCEEPLANKKKVDSIKESILKINPNIEVALTIFRPQPLTDINGKKIFLATTANEEILPKIKKSLEKNYRCEIVGTSTSLSNRHKLKNDLNQGLGKADTLLTEIKAASIDLAGSMADERGIEIVFLHNKTEVIGGTISSLEGEVEKIYQEIIDARGGR